MKCKNSKREIRKVRHKKRKYELQVDHSSILNQTHEKDMSVER